MSAPLSEPCHLFVRSHDRPSLGGGMQDYVRSAFDPELLKAPLDLNDGQIAVQRQGELVVLWSWRTDIRQWVPTHHAPPYQAAAQALAAIDALDERRAKAQAKSKPKPTPVDYSIYGRPEDW